MSAIGARINFKAKGAQKFFSNFAEKLWNFVEFVNRKQKAKTYLDGNQSI